MEPSAEGTLISSEIIGQGVKAIAAKDNITAIKIIIRFFIFFGDYYLLNKVNSI